MLLLCFLFNCPTLQKLLQIRWGSPKKPGIASFLQARCASCRLTNGVKELKAIGTIINKLKILVLLYFAYKISHNFWQSEIENITS